MDWTALLTSEVEDAFRATAGLMDLVDDDRLDWKPESGENWMSTRSLPSVALNWQRFAKRVTRFPMIFVQRPMPRLFICFTATNPGKNCRRWGSKLS